MSRFVLPPGVTKTIKIYLEFPLDKQYSGNKYMFVLHALAADEEVTSGVYFYQIKTPKYSETKKMVSLR